MKIKIVSDGTLENTTVRNAETGRVIEGVVRVEIIIDVNEPESPRAKVWFTDIAVEWIGDIAETRPPIPGLVSTPPKTPGRFERFVRAPWVWLGLGIHHGGKRDLPTHGI